MLCVCVCVCGVCVYVNLVRANATVVLLRCLAFTFGVFGRFSCIPIVYKQNKNYLIFLFAIFSKNGT